MRIGKVLPLLAILALGCSPRSQNQATTLPAPAGFRLEDRLADSGIDFTFTLPGPRPITILQSMPGGCAFLDFDNDGNLDVLLISQKVALYKGDGKGKFTDVTAATGLALKPGWWMGVAVGDYDNDGFDDLYLSQYGGGVLLHNDGGKRFADVTKQAGLGPQPWGSGCAFGDYDGDGRLDLFVGNYVDFGPHTIQRCPVKKIETSCSPTVYNPKFGLLLHNEGKGRFSDVTKKVVQGNLSGKVLVAVFADIDGSGRQSFFLANDETPADLLKNAGPGKKFANIAEPAGVAYQSDGKPFGGMGSDFADINDDGALDLFVGTFALENKLVFMNDGTGMFTDKSLPLGIAEPAMLLVTFGAKWLDIDNDGDWDLIFSNGYIADNIAEYEPSRAYRQPTMVFRNENSGERFTNQSETAGEALKRKIVGRGLATGDYDNDGRVDILVVDADGKPLLLHNETPQTGHWLSLKLIGTGRSNRNAFGAKVELTVGGKTHLLHCHADGSYFSASDPRVHFGLGSATTAEVKITWPSGNKEHFDVKADQVTTLREGDGKP